MSCTLLKAMIGTSSRCHWTVLNYIAILSARYVANTIIFENLGILILYFDCQ